MIATTIIRQHSILVIIGKNYTLVNFPDAWYWWEDETFPYCAFYNAYKEGIEKLGYVMEMYPKQRGQLRDNQYSVIPEHFIEEAQRITGYKSGYEMNRLAKQLYDKNIIHNQTKEQKTNT